MTATAPHPRRGRATSTLHTLTCATPVRTAVLLAVVVMCSGAWWDPREWVGQAIDGLLEKWAGAYAKLAESMLLGAFDGSLGTLGAAEWTIATIFTGRLGAVMGVFAVAFCAIEVIAGMAGRDPMRIFKGAAVALLAWPITATAAWATIKLTSISDSLSTAILSGSSAETVAARFFAPLHTLVVTNPAGTPVVLLIFSLVVLVPTVLLSLVMAFRAFGLLIAVAFAPVALMTQGWAKMRGMARGWATIVGALLVTKPLAAGIIVICLELIESMPDIGALVMGTVGLWMAAFAPVAAAGLFNFAGGEVAAAQGAASAQAGRHMVSAGRGAAKVGGAGAKMAAPKLAGGAAVAGGGGKTGGVADFLGGFMPQKGSKQAPSGGGAPGAGPSSGSPAAPQPPSETSTTTKPATSGNGSGAPAPATTSSAAPAASSSPVPSAAPAPNGPAGAGTAHGAPHQAPAAASTHNPPAASPHDAPAASSAPGGTGGARVPLGATTAGAEVGRSGGGLPFAGGPAGSPPLGALAAPSVSTTAGVGVSSPGAGSGAGGGPDIRSNTASSAPAPSAGGAVTTSEGRPAAHSGAPTPQVTGMDGVSSSVVDAAVDAVSAQGDVSKSEDSK